MTATETSPEQKKRARRGRRWLYFVAILAILVSAILVATPMVARQQLERWLLENGADEAVIENIDFNPFYGTFALKGMDVWICGLRKDQTVTRFFNRMVEWDEQHGLIKLNPIIEWTEKQVWAYTRENLVPYNVLHDKDFPSIGCKPCTRAVQPGEDSRAGRWWWENLEHKECGLHHRE